MDIFIHLQEPDIYCIFVHPNLDSVPLFVGMNLDCSDEGLTLETSAFESLYGGQFTLSTQLIKPNYLVIRIKGVSF